MADPTPVASTSLSARPGWSELCRAADDLHVAELLLGDPIAPARAAAPHLQDFWRAMLAVAVAAKLGAQDAADAGAWLSADIPGVDARTREQLATQVRALTSSQAASDQQLRAHARAARELLRTIEPIVGGGPLRTRRRRIAWTSLGLLIVFTPVSAYVAFNTKVEGEGPWRASYFTDRKLEGTPIIQREPSVDHDWGKDAPEEAVPPDKFSVRWDSCLQVTEAQAGPAVFTLNANDGARVFFDGELLIDGWERDSGVGRRGVGSGEIELTPGVHHLRVEYFESLGTASIKFAASFDGSVPAPLPSERLLYPGDAIDEDDPCAAVR